MSTPPDVIIETGDPSLFFGYPLLVDQRATTTFDSDTGIHNFMMEFTEGLGYQVEITVEGDTFDPILELDRADGSYLGGDSTEDGRTLRYSFVADQTDIWSMVISDEGLDDFYTQTYSVRVILTDWISDVAEETLAEFNDGGLITDVSFFASKTDYLGDVDLISMNLQGGVKYGFFLLGENPNYDPRLTIYDTDGVTKLKQVHKYNQVTNYTYTPDEDGIYYFEARDNAGNDDGFYIAGIYTSGSDEVEGTGSDDFVNTGGGGDFVETFDGNDTVNAGGGQDTIDAGAGNDNVSGGSGADSIEGGAGGDNLNGGAGTDELFGGSGDDSLNGGNQGDTLNGGGGDDSILGSGGADVLFGGNGEDTLNGGSKADEIDGGNEDDLLNGNGGRDSLGGGNGNDSLSGNAGRDTLDGGAGNDELSGAGGVDVFVFFNDWGNDVILDFESRDLILFASVSGLNNRDQLTIEDDDGDYVISFGDDSVTLLDAVGDIELGALIDNIDVG